MIDRIEFKQTVYDYHCQASRLLRATPDTFASDLAKFLRYIEETMIIGEYVQRCVSNNLPEEFDIEAEFKAVQGSYGSIFGPFGGSDEEELAEVYLILKAIQDSGVDGHSMLFFGYAQGSKKYQDMVKGFLDKVAFILISHIDRYLTKQGIAMGVDENLSQEFNIHDSSNTQINAASFGSSITATQSNGLGVEAIEPLLSAIIRCSEDLSDKDREVVQDSAQTLREDLAAEKPRKSVIKTALHALKGIKGGVDFAAAVAELVAFLAPFLAKG